MKSVIITYDPAKREATLRARGLDFEEAAQVFAGLRFTRRDERFAYGEDRYITLGLLHGQVVVVVWTPRDGGRRIISMRQANAKERAEFSGMAHRPEDR